MSILDHIRKLFGGEDIPDEAAEIYRMSRDERDALDRIDSARARSDRHRQTLIDDVKAITGEEERLVTEGKEEASSVKRRILAKQVAEIRGKTDDLMNRVDLLTRRIAIFDRQGALLRDRMVLDAPLPEQGDIQKAAEDALVARREFEGVADLADLHRDVSRIAGTAEGEREAMRELAGESGEELSFEEMLEQEESRARSGKATEDGREPLAE